MRLLVVLGLLVVIAGGTLTAVSDPDKAGSSPPAASDVADASATATPPPEETPTPVTNRQDCQAIRGQQYLSPEERTWFLANCVTR
jgi:hypothetical protein